MQSPYFQSPSSSVLRRSPRKTKAVALLTAMASASVLPAAVGGFSTPRKRQPKRPSPAAVTPTPTPKRRKASTANKKSKKGDKPVPVTNSFEPLWSNRFVDADDDDSNDPTPVHTLILGSHPSVKSLAQQNYYAHPMNAFWWIAGDCLGFRRASGVSQSTGKPYQFSADLRYAPDRVLSYEEQTKTLATKGFALWDVVASCQRPGSLDQDISNETPNDIREFCQQHGGSLKRIVLANGGTGCQLFVKHFRDWLESGQLQALPNHAASQKAFAKAIERGEKKRAKEGVAEKNGNDKIVLVSALGVSPANARFSYAEKRDEWDEVVYQPGLRDYEEQQRQRNK